MAHHKSLVRYAQRLRAARPCDAEDLVQDTLVKALTKQDRFQLGTDLGAWLRTLMHHLNADQARKREARFAHIPIPDDRDRSEGFEDVEQFVALSVPPAQEHAVHCRELVKHFLGDPLAQALPLSAIGYEKLEIAALLQAPIGTVSSRIARSRAKLREQAA